MKEGRAAKGKSWRVLDLKFKFEIFEIWNSRVPGVTIENRDINYGMSKRDTIFRGIGCLVFSLFPGALSTAALIHRWENGSQANGSIVFAIVLALFFLLLIYSGIVYLTKKFLIQLGEKQLLIRGIWVRKKDIDYDQIYLVKVQESNRDDGNCVVLELRGNRRLTLQQFEFRDEKTMMAFSEDLQRKIREKKAGGSLNAI